MKSKLLISILFIFTTSIISSIDIGNEYLPIKDSCKMEITHNSVKPCCCNGNHIELKLNQAIEIPVIFTCLVEFTNYRQIRSSKGKLAYQFETSTFFTPLNTIRLLI